MGSWGHGSLRERRPGVFEIRFAVGVDPVSGRIVQRSFWFHGALEDAEQRRSELASQFAEYRAVWRAAPFLTVGELLERWMAAHHDWQPSTWSSARSNVKALTADAIAGRRVLSLRPEAVRQAMARWKETGASVSVISGRFRVLRSSFGWAQSESIIDRNPIRDMRGPPRPGTRMHIPGGDVAALIEASVKLVEKAEAALDGSMGSLKALHRAEQVQLLVRLAADSGARRGELVALRFGDPDGRVLTIERGVSGEEVGPTKTRQLRRLTLGRTTVDLWRDSEAMWRRRAAGENDFGEWLFSSDLGHDRRLTASGLGHWFAALRDEAGLERVSLHRLRHSVATYLVGRGDLLQAQQRLGHRDASTTLLTYAHAMPLEDQEIADAIDEMLGASRDLQAAHAQVANWPDGRWPDSST
jgi:integrase